jgi:hypothetical protein
MTKSKSLPDHALRIRTYAGLQEYTQAFAAGHLNLLILSGLPGVGKSRGLRAAVGSNACWIDGNASACGTHSQIPSPRVCMSRLFRCSSGAT